MRLKYKLGRIFIYGLVGVYVGDNVFVLSEYDAAFEFHGWGEFAAFYAPYIGDESEFFYLFYVGEVGVHVVDYMLELL